MRVLDAAGGRYPGNVRRGAVIEVVEIGEVTLATVLAAGAAEEPAPDEGAEGGAPVEETLGVRA